MKIIRCIFAIVMLLSMFMAIYYYTGPHFLTVPLKGSITFSHDKSQRFGFTVDKSSVYLIEIYMNKIFADEEMDAIFGDAKSGSLIDVRWKIEKDDQIVGYGANTDYVYSPVLAYGMRGMRVGDAQLEENEKYYLSITSNKVDPTWDKANPIVQITLHPRDTEYLRAYFVYALLLFILSMIVFITIRGKGADEHDQ